MLHLSLIVREIRQEPDGEHVSVIATLQEQKPTTDQQPEPKGRIIRIGIQKSDDDIEKGFQEQIAEALGHLKLPCARPQIPKVAVVMFLTKQMFNDLGRPTWGDTLQLEGRTIRQYRQ